MQISSPTNRDFDGVICFGGEDWWYHNRGHYDMRVMQQLAKRMPVLFVNSLGMRLPSPKEGAMFITRVTRKLASWFKGRVLIRDQFNVCTPAFIPGRLGAMLSNRILAFQVRRHARALGIKRPLVWISCPVAAKAAKALNASGMVFQRTDRHEAFGGINAEHIKDLCTELRADADLTLYCSRDLQQQEQTTCRESAWVDHGLAFERFACPNQTPPTPPLLSQIRRPMIGFVGGLDAHTFDLPFFLQVAKSLPDFQFVLVGNSSFPEGSFEQANVLHLPQVAPSEVPAYLHACDVLIMPWCRNEWIRACNPIKLKEYLATGLPVVSTPFPALDPYRDLVRVASSLDDFVWSIRVARFSGNDANACRTRVEHQTWGSKAAEILSALKATGLTPTHDEPSEAPHPTLDPCAA